MPRRTKPDPLARKIGERVRALRQERGLTLEALAWSRDGEAGGSKGHLSDLERGLTVPNVATLRALAEQLECSPADLVTFPDAGVGDEVRDALRGLSDRDLRRVLRFVRDLRPR